MLKKSLGLQETLLRQLISVHKQSAESHVCKAALFCLFLLRILLISSSFCALPSILSFCQTTFLDVILLTVAVASFRCN